ncbi:hypothetical protein BASA81_008454 [Batrachochytrium salamandrivorans]|nr:hypothetical protein BASA81_008454 [Batrachochytrium salamandrivorans]
MASKIAQILAQALVMGGGVAIKAFVQAYQRVAAAKAAADAAKKSNTFVRAAITTREARQILNFENAPIPIPPTELQERYEKYFAANDPAKGGSFYVQSKIYRAKEALEKETKQ